MNHVMKIAARNRPLEYERWLDLKLALLGTDEKRDAFCGKQTIEWTARYELWVKHVEKGKVEDKPGDWTAWDFLEIICAIDTRRSKFKDRIASRTAGEGTASPASPSSSLLPEVSP